MKEKKTHLFCIGQTTRRTETESNNSNNKKGEKYYAQVCKSIATYQQI